MPVSCASPRGRREGKAKSGSRDRDRRPFDNCIIDLATSFSNNPNPSAHDAHPVNPPGAPYAGVDDPAHLSFASFTPPPANAPSLPKAYSHTSTNYRNSISRQTVTHYTQTSSCFDFSEKPPLQDEVPYISDDDVPPLFATETMDFADLFPDTPPDDKPTAGESSSSTFLSLFNLYIETHKALTEIRAGIQEVSIADLKDGQGVMRTIISINELGRTTMNVCNTNMSPSLAIAFLMVVQGCELVEQILIAILPSGRPPTRSNSAESLAIDYSWTTCSAMFDGHPKLSVEHITALLQLDIHLSQFNSFVSTFMQMTQEQEPSANIMAVQCRKRLLHFHTQIRSVVDSMIPAWE